MSATATKPPSKMDGVRMALEALGKSATPKEIMAWMKAEHGLDISGNQASNYKSNILSGGGKKPGKRGRKPGSAGKAPAASANGHVDAPPAPAPRRHPLEPADSEPEGAYTREDILAVKALMERIGPGKVRGLVAIL